MKYNFFIIAIFFILMSCEGTKARRPKQHSTTNFYKEVIEHNKKLNKREKYFLEQLIKKDTLNHYQTSSNGFWYTYVKKDTLSSLTPQKNDLVTIEYDIKDINNVSLYPTQKIAYKVDKQDFIQALQDGVKLMKKGETITFLIPSYRGYGVVGDGDKIGINQPIKSTVTLIDIKQENNESK